MDNLKQIVLSMGKPMPSIGLGCSVGPVCKDKYDTIQLFIEAAVDIGYRHFDTAFLYDTEVPLGRALDAKIKAGVITRDDIFITSKLSWDSHHPDDVRNCFHKTLANLALEYVDLYLIHWPAPVIKQAVGLSLTAPLTAPFDYENDYVTVWKVLEDLVKEGYIKAIGLSNFNRTQVDKILHHCSIKPVVNQCEVHLYHQCKELIKHHRDRGLTVVGSTPLGIRESSVTTADHWDFPLEDPVVLELSQKYKKTPAQVALRFLVQQGVACIPGSTKPGHQAENIQIFDFEIDEEDVQKLRSIDRKKRKVQVVPLKNHKEYPYNEPF